MSNTKENENLTSTTAIPSSSFHLAILDANPLTYQIFDPDIDDCLDQPLHNNNNNNGQCITTTISEELEEEQHTDRLDSMTIIHPPGTNNNPGCNFGLLEKDTIIGSIQQSHCAVQLQYSWATVEILKQMMETNDMVVIGAHGTLATNTSSGFIALENERGFAIAVHPHDVYPLFSTTTNKVFQSQIIILGACYSEDIGMEFIKLPGIRYVIATKRGPEGRVQTRVCEAFVASIIGDVLNGEISVIDAFFNAIKIISTLECLTDDESRERQLHKFVLITRGDDTPGWSGSSNKIQTIDYDHHWPMYVTNRNSNTIPFSNDNCFKHQIVSVPRNSGELEILPTSRFKPRTCLPYVNRIPPIVGRDVVLREIVGFLTHPKVDIVILHSSQPGLGATRVIGAVCDFLLEHDRINDIFVISKDGSCNVDSGSSSNGNNNAFNLFVVDFHPVDFVWVKGIFDQIKKQQIHSSSKLLVVVCQHDDPRTLLELNSPMNKTIVVSLPKLTPKQSSWLLEEAGYGFEILGNDRERILGEGQGNPKRLLDAVNTLLNNRQQCLSSGLFAQTSTTTTTGLITNSSISNNSSVLFPFGASTTSTATSSLFTNSSSFGYVMNHEFDSSSSSTFTNRFDHGDDISPISKLVRALSHGNGTITTTSNTATSTSGGTSWKNFVTALQQVFASQVYAGTSAFDWCHHTVRGLNELDLTYVRRKLILTANNNNNSNSLFLPPRSSSFGGSSMIDNTVMTPDMVRTVWREWLAPTLRTLHQVEPYWTRHLVNGFATREEIEAKLIGKNPGAFLIRVSDSKPGFLVVSYVTNVPLVPLAVGKNNNNLTATTTTQPPPSQLYEIIHVLISVLSSDGKISVPFRNEIRMFPSLSDFVLNSSSLNEVVMLPAHSSTTSSSSSSLNTSSNYYYVKEELIRKEEVFVTFG
jgi:hypothetical protein